ncbi:MAG TPA: FtsQ-type POTRA domain-containing protein [Opitutaceae bacterium]|nr:FtsQ-type POTRA domain-containing protein [Opitutaceae bacterium]
MSKLATIAPPARTWQDISQEVNPRAMSKAGRRRRLGALLKIGGGILLAATAAWGALEVYRVVAAPPQKLAAAGTEVPLKDVTLVTDGVLDHAWVVRTLALPKNASLMTLDLYALRARLLADGQVCAAVLTRNFPATLAVSLQERAPVARLMAQIGAAAPRALLVARDGVVYDGEDYAPALLNSLPWLDGVRLVRSGRGFAPIDGMETVADLLATARNQAEPLYRSFQVVSLAHLAADGELLVRTKEIPEVTFNTRDDFFRQLARLDYVLDLARTQPDKPLKSVNLADGLQVPVALETNLAAPPAVRVAAPAPDGGTFVPLHLNHIAQRDF